MNDWGRYIWHVAVRRGEWTPVVVLAWHEGSATVMPLGSDDQPIEGEFPFLVKLNELRFGRPPEQAAVA